MDPIERYKLEDEAHSLAAQCTCYSYHGPCRFCNRLDKIHRQLDRMDVEDEVVSNITEWLGNAKFMAVSGSEIIAAISHGISSKEWKKKDAQL